jgi:single-strand DNA-binding protein
MSLNKVILIGRLGKDPEIRTLQNGGEIASFSLATSESWKNKAGEKQQKTEWHSVVCFNPGITSVIKNYVKKGSRIYIEGSIQTRKWDKDGVDHYKTEIVLQVFNSTLKLLDGKPEGQDNKEVNNAPLASPSFDLDDEIPFN